MFAAVADTHTVIWHLFASPFLSQRAKHVIDQAIQAGQYIAVSAITLAEIVYLAEKGRISQDTLPRLLEVLQDPANARSSQRNSA